MTTELFAVFFTSITFAFACTRLLPKFKSAETKSQRLRLSGKPTKSSRLPLVGGPAITMSIAVGYFLLRAQNELLLYLLLITSAFMMCGLLDDILKTRGKGLSEKTSLILAVLASIMAASIMNGHTISDSHFSFAYWTNYNQLVWFIHFCLFLCITVSTGISDGVDGLTTGLGAISLAAILGASIFIGTDHLPTTICLIATVGFIPLNWPSKWRPGLISGRAAISYLGDSGALAIGAMITAAAIMSGAEIMLPLIAGVLLLEGLSSVVQAKIMVPICRRVALLGGPQRESVHHSYFPLPFIATPIHHHIELIGIDRLSLVFLFWILGILFALITLSVVAVNSWASIIYFAVGISIMILFWGILSLFRPSYLVVARLNERLVKVSRLQGNPESVFNRVVESATCTTDNFDLLDIPTDTKLNHEVARNLMATLRDSSS